MENNKQEEQPKIEEKHESLINKSPENEEKFEQKEGDIGIQVTDPIVKDGGMQKFIVYTVKGKDKDGPYEAFRRYSDFTYLRQALLNRWPGCYVPPIPPKKLIGNLNAKFIDDRRKYLEKFCTSLAKLKHLFYSEEFNIFIRSSATEVEKAFNGLPKLTSEELISKYHKNFSFLAGKEINTDLILKLTTFHQYLKKSKEILENLKTMAKKHGKSKEKLQ